MTGRGGSTSGTDRALHVAGAAREWDERRNSSRVIPPAPDALPNALRALAAFERDYPALHSWISEGAPTLSDAEHLTRFGEPYRATRQRAREKGS